METAAQIEKFREFIELASLTELLNQAQRGRQVLIIDFLELSKFDPELSDTLLEDPENVIKAAELAILQFDLPGEKKDFRVRLKNLPASQKIMVRDIRSEHIGKFVFIDGVVRQKSDVRPQVTTARFECPSCGQVITVLQLDSKFNEPSRCGCGRKGKFKLLSKELVDAQRIVLEEAPEELEGGEQPKRMDVFLKADLVSPIGDKKTNPGTRIVVNGIVREVPIILRTGGQSIRYDLLVDANYVESVDEDFADLIISSEESEQIKQLAADPEVYTKLIESIAPSIYGLDKIKEAIMLQLMGGVQKKREDGVTTRGDMHVLLIGDPGAAKSQLLKRAKVIAPRARYVSGKGATGAGLTAAVVRDEFLKGWALEAGALVLANRGFCMIDELDKMNKEDRDAMHEALEQQTVTISKANIQATLRCETTVLAAANPKHGRFDPYGIIADQIDLPPTLINRFDLIFPIKDLPDPAHDSNLAGFILKLHQDVNSRKADIKTELLRKFVAYARRYIHPKLTDVALEEIRDYYVRMRSSGIQEGQRPVIPITARQLEALVRLSEATARVRFSQTVDQKDAQKAIELLDYCLTLIGLDKETGKIDIDRIATGISSSQRNLLLTVKEIIHDLDASGMREIPIEEIVRRAMEKGMNQEKVDEIIDKLKRSGDIFEPKHGMISKL